MAFSIQNLLETKPKPVCVQQDSSAIEALSIMVDKDYSQLPVIGRDNKPVGIITYESILKAIRTFKASLEDLSTKRVMIRPVTSTPEEDLFDIFEKMKKLNAILVTTDKGSLTGILTSFDFTEYFREQAEDLMRVQDVEETIKDLILTAHTNEDKKIDTEIIYYIIYGITKNNPFYQSASEKPGFDDLTLGDYINMLLHTETWKKIEPILELKRESVRHLLTSVQDIRNNLMHYRSEIDAFQREQLRACNDLMSQLLEEFRVHSSQTAPVTKHNGENVFEKLEEILKNDASQAVRKKEAHISHSKQQGGKYAQLIEFLLEQPGEETHVELPFTRIEKMIDSNLPPSARNHRAWWANDSVGHSHSQQWLEAGWRRTYLNMSEERVTFARIQEREKAYISFFSKLLEEFRNYPDFPLRDVSPVGGNWVIVQTLPKRGAAVGSFSISFTHGKRMRIELYINTGKPAMQHQNKAIFDKLFTHKEDLEARLGPIEWERLNHRKASRIAIYTDGYILEEEKHSELIKWAADTTNKFYTAIADLAETAILEVLAE
jgi:CBS domain-containing protein